MDFDPVGTRYYCPPGYVKSDRMVETEWVDRHGVVKRRMVRVTVLYTEREWQKLIEREEER